MYPQCLIDELAAYGQKPTYDLEWDRLVLATMKKRTRDAASLEIEKLHLSSVAAREAMTKKAPVPDLTNPEIFQAHAKYFLHIANTVVLAPQGRVFEIDDNNRTVLRFLLYYFNDCPLADEVYPGRGYKRHKHLLLQGEVGVGKTLLMRCFSEYLHRIRSPRAFRNVSVTQMVSSYSINNNLNSYTWCEDRTAAFLCNPENLCLNDIGIASKQFYGMDTGKIIEEFLYARNEIWEDYDRFAHMTTNLSVEDLHKLFEKKNEPNRLIDRFKTYNVVPLGGTSRR